MVEHRRAGIRFSRGCSRSSSGSAPRRSPSTSSLPSGERRALPAPRPGVETTVGMGPVRRLPRLGPAWDAAALPTLAPRHRGLLLVLVEHHGLTAAAFCGRPRGPSAGPAVFESKLPPMGSTPGFAFASGLDRAGRRAAVAAFERALFRRLGWRCLGVAYRQVGQGELDACDGPGRPRSPPTRWRCWRTAGRPWTSTWPASPTGGRAAAFDQRALDADPDLQIGLGAQVDAGAASRLASHRPRHRRGRLDAPASRCPRRASTPCQPRRRALPHLPGRRGRVLAFALALTTAVARRHHVGFARSAPDGRKNRLFDHYLRLIALA